MLLLPSVLAFVLAKSPGKFSSLPAVVTVYTEVMHWSTLKGDIRGRIGF